MLFEIICYVCLLSIKVLLFEKVLENIVLVCILVFDYVFKKDIDVVIVKYLDMILKIENFIIDIWGNGGGSDVSYVFLFFILYINFICIVGMEYLFIEFNNFRMFGFL